MNILEMKGVSKAFGGAKALKDVHFSVAESEIHALLGENGAGKSTLMNILTGVIPMDSGHIEFEGVDYPHPTIMEMESVGIAFVHQEINVVNDLTVYENIFLNRELKNKLGFLDKKSMIKSTTELFRNLGVNIDPNNMVSELKTSEKQLLEICRALHEDAKLLILDEPTTALSSQEVDHLFGILRRLREKGKSFIFISHKMPEIFEIAQSYTVFRNGNYVSSGAIKDTTPHQIAADMVGEEYIDENLYISRPLGETIMEVENLTGHGFSEVTLSLRKGEIVAFTGLAGSGASELMQTMFGVLPSVSGHIKIKKKVVDGNITSFMKNGVGMLPSNRKENSVLPDMTILENIYIAEHSISRKKPIISNKKEIENYHSLKKMLRIKAQSHLDPIHSLSGGNQQKIFLGRWVNTEAEVLLFDNPTQGVDVGAKAEIYKLILGFACKGKTVIINTLEIPEIKKVSDRCFVFFEGKVIKELTHAEINERDVMLYSTNANYDKGV